MKITFTSRKPRNPLVASARFRRAGSHAQPQRAQRRQARRELQRELEHWPHSP